MPRRKYGHMVGTCPPTPQEKCRACRLNHPCPIHDTRDRPNFKALAKKKRKKKTGKKDKKMHRKRVKA